MNFEELDRLDEEYRSADIDQFLNETPPNYQSFTDIYEDSLNPIKNTQEDEISLQQDLENQENMAIKQDNHTLIDSEHADLVHRLINELHMTRVSNETLQLMFQDSAIRIQALQTRESMLKREKDQLRVDLAFAEEDKILLQAEIKDIAHFEQHQQPRILENIRGTLFERNQQELREYAERARSLIIEKDELQQEFEGKNQWLMSENTSLRREIQRMSEQLATRAVLFEANQREMLSKINHQKIDFTDQQKELITMTSKYQELMEQHQRISLERDQFLLQLREQQLTNEHNNEENMNLTERIQDLEDSLTTISQRNQDLENNIKNLLSNDMETIQTDLYQTIERLKSDSKLKEDRYQHEIHELQDQIRKQQSRHDQIIEDYQDLQHELTNQKQYIQDLILQAEQTEQQSTTLPPPFQLQPNYDTNETESDHSIASSLDLVDFQNQIIPDNQPQTPQQHTTTIDSDALTYDLLEKLTKLNTLSKQWKEVWPVKSKQEIDLFVVRCQNLLEFSKLPSSLLSSMYLKDYFLSVGQLILHTKDTTDQFIEDQQQMKTFTSPRSQAINPTMTPPSSGNNINNTENNINNIDIEKLQKDHVKLLKVLKHVLKQASELKLPVIDEPHIKPLISQIQTPTQSPAQFTPATPPPIPQETIDNIKRQQDQLWNEKEQAWICEKERLLQQLQSLQEEIVAHQELFKNIKEMGKLEAVDSLQGKIDALSIEKTHIETLLQETNLEVIKLKTQNKHFEESIVFTEQRLDIVNKENALLTSQLEDLQTESKSHQEESLAKSNSLGLEIDSLKVQLVSQEELLAKVNSLNLEIESLKAQLVSQEELLATNGSLELEIDSIKEQIVSQEELLATNNSLGLEITSLKAQLISQEELLTTNNSLELEIESLKKQIGSQEELMTLQQQKEDLKHQLQEILSLNESNQTQSQLQIENLNNQIQEHMNDWEISKQQYLQQLQEKEEQPLQLQTQLAELQEKYDFLSHKLQINENFEEQLSNILEEKQILSDEKQMLSEEKKMLAVQLTTLQDLLTQQNQHIIELDTNQEQLQLERNKLQEDLEVLSDNFEVITNQLNEKTMEYEDISTNYSNLLLEKIQLAEEKDRIFVDLTEIQHQLDEKLILLTQIEETKDHLIEEVEQLQEKNRELSQQIIELTTSVTEKSLQITQLTEEQRFVLQEKESFQETIEQLTSQVKEIQLILEKEKENHQILIETNDSHTKIEEFEQEIHTLNQEITTKNETISLIQSQLQENQSFIHKLELDNIQLSEEVNNLTEEIQTIQSLYDESIEDYQLLQTHSQQTQAHNQELQHSLEDVTQQFQQQTVLTQETQEQLTLVRHQNSSIQDTNLTLTQQIQELTASKGSLQETSAQEIQILQNSVQVQTMKYQILEIKCSDLESKLTQLKANEKNHQNTLFNQWKQTISTSVFSKFDQYSDNLLDSLEEIFQFYEEKINDSIQILHDYHQLQLKNQTHSNSTKLLPKDSHYSLMSAITFEDENYVLSTESEASNEEIVSEELEELEEEDLINQEEVVDQFSRSNHDPIPFESDLNIELQPLEPIELPPPVIMIEEYENLQQLYQVSLSKYHELLEQTNLLTKEKQYYSEQNDYNYQRVLQYEQELQEFEDSLSEIQGKLTLRQQGYQEEKEYLLGQYEQLYIQYQIELHRQEQEALDSEMNKVDEEVNTDLEQIPITQRSDASINTMIATNDSIGVQTTEAVQSQQLIPSNPTKHTTKSNANDIPSDLTILQTMHESTLLDLEKSFQHLSNMKVPSFPALPSAIQRNDSSEDITHSTSQQDIITSTKLLQGKINQLTNQHEEEMQALMTTHEEEMRLLRKEYRTKYKREKGLLQAQIDSLQQQLDESKKSYANLSQEIQINNQKSNPLDTSDFINETLDISQITLSSPIYSPIRQNKFLDEEHIESKQSNDKEHDQQVHHHSLHHEIQSLPLDIQELVKEKVKHEKKKLYKKFQEKLNEKESLFAQEKEQILSLVKQECQEITEETSRLVLAKRELEIQKAQFSEMLAEASQNTVFNTPTRSQASFQGSRSLNQSLNKSPAIPFPPLDSSINSFPNQQSISQSVYASSLQSMFPSSSSSLHVKPSPAREQSALRESVSSLGTNITSNSQMKSLSNLNVVYPELMSPEMTRVFIDSLASRLSTDKRN